MSSGARRICGSATCASAITVVAATGSMRSSAPVILIRHGVQQAVRSLPHIAEALVQLGEHRLATQLFQLRVEHQSFQAAGARNFTATRAGHEQIALPGRKLVPGIERQAAGGMEGNHTTSG